MAHGGYVSSCQEPKSGKKNRQKKCISVTDAHYLGNTFDGVNENQTSSPLAVASLIIFSAGTLVLL